MNKLLTTITLLCFSVAVNAQIIETEQVFNFLKVDDPTTLNYNYFHMSDCPFTEMQANNIIESVIERYRITPVNTSSLDDLYLKVYPFCVSVRGYVAYDYGIGFGRGFLEYSQGYLTAGSMPEDRNVYALNELRAGIEEAIEDFVTVNFLSDSN